MIALTRLHTDINERVDDIRGNHPDWLCGKGCDSCCRRLAEVPQLTEAEWVLLQQGLAALSPRHLAQISQHMTVLAGEKNRPVVCPLLDQTTGACPVYAQRPVACRTYGFYVQRDKGLYCSDIEKSVAEGGLNDVVWGNHDAIDQRVAGLGESHSLTEWFAAWMHGR
jgi:Fe-S-cluster containining protein